MIDIGKPYVGNAYRVDIENLGISGDMTVADIIRFEREELGNTYDISEDELKALDNYRARDAVWVTKKKNDAEFYLSEGMSLKDISKIDLPPDSRIVAEDGQGGYLVLQGDAEAVNKGFKLSEVVPKVGEFTLKQKEAIMG